MLHDAAKRCEETQYALRVLVGFNRKTFKCQTLFNGQRSDFGLNVHIKGYSSCCTITVS